MVEGSEDRLTSLGQVEGDAIGQTDAGLRPTRLVDFIGQDEARANLRIFIDAATSRNEAMDHVRRGDAHGRVVVTIK